MLDPDAPPTSAALSVSALIIYALVTLMGLVVMRWQDIEVVPAVFGASDADLRVHAALGIGAGLALVGVTRALSGWAPMRALEELVRESLGRPGSVAIIVLAVTSAVGEEILFRGALQPLLGFWMTALLFGLMHGGTMRRFRAWVVFAILAGLLFGALASFTGDLLAPTLCHFTVNYFNLHRLARLEP
ncbi:MAG: CPBP family intramembrane metalloprotease [Deltaproteobacteria bacterium]|nr:CPBP family intramembrane metalloprotease [Deltaproteobacteria bacterium]